MKRSRYNGSRRRGSCGDVRSAAVGLVKIHYPGVRILFAVREGIQGGSRAAEAPVAFLSLGRRYLDGGCPFITQPKYSPTFCAMLTMHVERFRPTLSEHAVVLSLSIFCLFRSLLHSASFVQTTRPRVRTRARALARRARVDIRRDTEQRRPVKVDPGKPGGRAQEVAERERKGAGSGA